MKCARYSTVFIYMFLVPVSSEVKLDDGITNSHEDYRLTRLLLGGDLIIARAQSAKGITVDHETQRAVYRASFQSLKIGTHG